MIDPIDVFATLLPQALCSLGMHGQAMEVIAVYVDERVDGEGLMDALVFAAISESLGRGRDCEILASAIGHLRQWEVLTDQQPEPRTDGVADLREYMMPPGAAVNAGLHLRRAHALLKGLVVECDDEERS